MGEEDDIKEEKNSEEIAKDEELPPQFVRAKM